MSQLLYQILQGYHPKRKCRVGEEGYTCINITTCPCINTSYTFVTLIGCVLFVIIPACVDNCVCVFFFYFECFYIVFYQSFLTFMSKIKKHIRKSKNFDRHYCVLSQACFALYLCTNGFVHLRA